MSREESAEARLAEIETRLMLSDDLLEALNRTLYRQQQHIDRLQREVRALRDQVDGMGAASEPRTLRDDVPPHY